MEADPMPAIAFLLLFEVVVLLIVLLCEMSDGQKLKLFWIDRPDLGNIHHHSNVGNIVPVVQQPYV